MTGSEAAVLVCAWLLAASVLSAINTAWLTRLNFGFFTIIILPTSTRYFCENQAAGSQTLALLLSYF
ncbi:hypothetical protein ACQ4WM_12265 [Janthinobacterium sp. RB2R34]